MINKYCFRTMETGSSSEEISSSECETESSCEDEGESLETAKICGATLQLPQGLCESKEIFKEMFSLKTWNSLSEINKQHLKSFLPFFPENDDQEKNITLQKFFNKEKFRFVLAFYTVKAPFWFVGSKRSIFFLLIHNFNSTLNIFNVVKMKFSKFSIKNYI